MKNLAKMAVCLSLIPTYVTAHEAHQTQKMENDWSVSYSYMQMSMSGIKDGTSDVTAAQVLADGFTMAPKDMDVQTHQFDIGYGITSGTQVNLSIPYSIKKMTSEDAMSEMKMKSEGLADISINASTEIDDNIKVYYGLSIPTGSIKERDGMALEYMMQQGSGTFDPIIGIGYDSKNYGASAKAKFRLADNSQDYRLGNEYNASVWVGGAINPVVNAAFKLNGKAWDNIKGANPALMVMDSPANDPKKQGGQMLEAAINLGFKPAPTYLINLEVGVPIYQNLDGPQLEHDSHVMLGLQKDF